MGRLLAKHAVPSQEAERFVRAALGRYRGRGTARELFVHPRRVEFLELVAAAVHDYHWARENAEALRTCNLEPAADNFLLASDFVRGLLKERAMCAAESQRWLVRRDVLDQAFKARLEAHAGLVDGDGVALVRWVSAEHKHFDVQRFQNDHPALYAQYVEPRTRRWPAYSSLELEPEIA